MRKWSGSHEARPPNLSLCRRTPHYCTSWALGVAFEVLWGTSSHETSIVNPLVNQVCSWAYVWSGSFSSEDSKRSKEIVAGWKRRDIGNFLDKIREPLCQNTHNVPNLLYSSAPQQALTSKWVGEVTFLKYQVSLNYTKCELVSALWFSLYWLFKISISHLLQQTGVVTPQVLVCELKYERGDWEGWRLASHACLPRSLPIHSWWMGCLPFSPQQTGNRQKWERERERDGCISLTPARSLSLSLSVSPSFSLSPQKPVGRSEAEPRRPGAASPCCANKSPFHFN